MFIIGENRRLICRILLITALLVIFPYSVYGAVYYVSPAGSDTTGDGSYDNPWQTIVYATGMMSGGDTLILKDGVYYNDSMQNMISPPSGSAGNYTVVKAENDWQAIIDGQGFPLYTQYPVHIEGKSYIQIEGLKIRNGSASEAIHISNSHHIKVFRTSVINGVPYDAEYGNVVTVSDGSQYVLLEDVWVTGAMRYGVLAYGDYDDRDSPTSKIIFRRVVVRWDYINSNQPKAAFAFYGNNDGPDPDITPLRDVMCQNCIAIDTNPGNAYTLMSAGFSNIKNARNVKHYGSIALNIRVGGTYSPGNGFVVTEYEKSGGNEIHNSVAWDVSGTGFAMRDSDTTLQNVIDQSTVGKADRGVYEFGTVSGEILVKNSIFYNNNNVNTGDIVESYNIYYPASLKPSGSTNSLTDDPGLKYITRIEAGSPGDGTGENGVDRGANILYRYGVSGTLWGEAGFDQLTDEPLWPWPYEDQIKKDFSEPNDPPTGAYPTTNDTKRGFCADGKGLYGGNITLTSYIWEYLGNPCPSEICNYEPPSPPQNLQVR